MKTVPPILLFVCCTLLSCAGIGSKFILEEAVRNADKETLSVELVEQSDGTANYIVRSASGLSWRLPTLGYAPGKPGVDGIKQRDYYALSQIPATNWSVIALQEHGELGAHAFFVTQGRKGTLYVVRYATRDRKNLKPGEPSYWYTWRITGLSRQGMFMGGDAFFRWRDIVTKEARFETEAIEPIRGIDD